jgi:hypothetical protein
MAVTLSFVVLFAIPLAFLLKSRSLSVGAAFVAVMFGFYLASTGAAGPVNRMTAAVFHAIPGLH